MVVGKAVIVAGIGSRKGVTAGEVLAAIDAALAAHGLQREDLALLATAELKRDEAGVREAAEALGLELNVFESAALAAASDRTLTRSDASMIKAGTPSVSEASALAAAGPDARLLGPRLVQGSATCALATSDAIAHAEGSAGRFPAAPSNTPHPTSRAELAASRDLGASATFSLKGRRESVASSATANRLRWWLAVTSMQPVLLPLREKVADKLVTRLCRGASAVGRMRGDLAPIGTAR